MPAVSRLVSAGTLKIIETSADKIYTQRVLKPLHQVGANGINGTLYDHNGSVMILINKGKPVGNNAIWNGWKQPPRPVIYYDGDKVRYEVVKSVDELKTPLNQIIWAVGGGSIPHNTSEKFGGDVTRVAQRTALAYKGNKVYLIATHTPMDIPRLTEAIYGSLDIDKAIFLDGGGSTQMFFKEPILSTSRKIDNGIFIKE